MMEKNDCVLCGTLLEASEGSVERRGKFYAGQLSGCRMVTTSSLQPTLQGEQEAHIRVHSRSLLLPTLVKVRSTWENTQLRKNKSQGSLNISPSDIMTKYCQETGP